MSRVQACRRCLARAWLLARVAGHLDLVRDRIYSLLELDEAELIAAVAGGRRSEIELDLRQFHASAARHRAGQAGLELVCRCADAYPPGLRELASAPAVLHVGGGLEHLEALLGERPVAIVGSRRASPYGFGVTSSVKVSVRETARLAEVVDAVMGSGANILASFRFLLHDERKHRRAHFSASRVESSAVDHARPIRLPPFRLPAPHEPASVVVVVGAIRLVPPVQTPTRHMRIRGQLPDVPRLHIPVAPGLCG